MTSHKHSGGQVCREKLDLIGRIVRCLDDEAIVRYGGLWVWRIELDGDWSRERKKFHKLGKLGSSKSGEGIAKFGFSYPSHPFYSKYQATTSTRWKIYKKKNSHVKGKEPLINCLFFSFPLFYSEIQETTSTRWKTLTYIKTTPKSFFLDKNQEKFVFVSLSCSRSNFYFGFWYTRYFFSILIIAA